MSFKRKYLLRLKQTAIPHEEFARTSSQAAAMIRQLGKEGLAECVDLDGNEVEPDGEDAYWQITEKGLRMVGPVDA